MLSRKWLWVFVATTLLLLMMTTGAQAAPATQGSSPISITIPYSGQLTDVDGQSVMDGAYDFVFTLYASPTGGAPLWSETQEDVLVSAGGFHVALARDQPISPAVLASKELWLLVAVRGPKEVSFTTLLPRQSVSAVSASSSPESQTVAVCPHNHLAEDWGGNVTPFGLAIRNYNPDADALQAWAQSALHAAVYGWNNKGAALVGRSIEHHGVYSEGGGAYKEHAAFKAASTNASCGMASYMINNSSCPTAEFDQKGGGRVLDLQNGGTGSGQGSGDFIAAFNNDSPAQLKFRVGGKGDVWTRDGYYMISQDFAEMLPAALGLEPGDVLAIALDGKLTLSTSPNQTNVAGVYSTQPGIVAGMPEQGVLFGTVPLAVVGIVPVKVTAENGPIHAGNLLVSSSKPGYAMKAGPNPPDGAIIGKALETLNTGLGVIKMLVTLQ